MGKIQIAYEGHLRTKALHVESGAVIKTDAPKDNMGKGEMFSPTDLLAVSLGTCVLTLMGIVADKLKVDLTGMRATVEKEMVSTPARRIGKVVVHVYCPTIFEPQITIKLEQAGAGCPVHHSLHPDLKQEFTFHWGEV